MENKELSPKRIREIAKRTLGEYNASSQIPKYIHEYKINERQTDGNFTKVGLRPLLERRILLPQQGPTYVAPAIIGLGRSVALAERNHFLSTILDNNQVERSRHYLDRFSPQKFAEHLNEIRGEPEIFMDSSIKRELFRRQEWRTHLGYKGGTAYFNNFFPIYPVGGDGFKGKIILFDRLSSTWVRVLFESRILEEKSPLNIQIGKQRNDEMVDLLVHSMIKFRIHEPNKIKILESPE